VNVLADAPRRDDEPLTEILRRILSPNDNCVDVGCNVGQVLEKIVSLAPRGRHFAFEALPSLASDAARRFPTVTVSAARPFVYFEHGRGGSEYYGTTPELIHRFLCTDCGLQIWRPPDWILGQAPLDVTAFRQAYERGDGWNYLAAP